MRRPLPSNEPPKRQPRNRQSAEHLQDQSLQMTLTKPPMQQRFAVKLGGFVDGLGVSVSFSSPNRDFPNDPS